MVIMMMIINIMMMMPIDYYENILIDDMISNHETQNDERASKPEKKAFRSL